jgi:hypothetical protein
VTEDWAIAAPEAAKTAKATSDYIIRKVVQRCHKCSAQQLQSCALFLYGNKHTTIQIQLHHFLQTMQTEMFW